MSQPLPFQPSATTTTTTQPVQVVPTAQTLIMDPKVKPAQLAGVRVIMTYRQADGSLTHGEIVVNPNDNIIDSNTITQEQKIAKAKDEEGNLIGFEPTGEYTLLLKLKYHKKD